MDLMTIMYLLLVGMVFLFLGRYFDKYWRAKMMRSIFHKNYAILKIASKEGNRVLKYIINLDKDLISVGNEKWAVQAHHIYVETDAAKGFVANQKSIHWDEGLPVITVDRDSVKPIGYYHDTSGSVKPEEVGATFGAWIANEIAKGMGALNNMNMLLIIACVLSLGAAGMGYMNYTAIADLKTQMTAVDSNVGMLVALNYDALVAKGILVPPKVVNVTTINR